MNIEIFQKTCLDFSEDSPNDRIIGKQIIFDSERMQGKGSLFR